MFEVNDAPHLAECDVIEKIRSEIVIEDFLFYRTGFDECYGLDDGESPAWECECTACGARFLEEKQRKSTPKKWTSCPRCGQKITPRRWRDRAVLDGQELSFQVFQRGAGKEIWLHGYQVSRDRDGAFQIFEYSRAVFYPGGAQRWRRTPAGSFADTSPAGVYPERYKAWTGTCFMRAAGNSEWEECRKVILKRWHGAYGRTRGNWFGAIWPEEIQGTVMEYSQFDEALVSLCDPVEYLALYCRYPLVELLWKMNLGNLLKSREMGGKSAFVRAVNLRAKSPRTLLPGLDKRDMKLLRGKGVWDVWHLLRYKMLRQAGAVDADEAGLEYARAVEATQAHVQERAGNRETYRYFQRQKKRCGRELNTLLRDWGDYLDELAEVGSCCEFPVDLPEAHARLSVRLRKKKTDGQNVQFRARRHILSKYRFARDGLLIRPIDSADEMIREGEAQNNCVAGYAGRHIQGKTAIFVLRRKAAPREPFCTVEWNRASNQVIQCRIKNNREAPPEAWEFIEAWKKHNEEIGV